MRVTCSVDQVYIAGEHGDDVESVSATCPRCHHQTESYGTSSSSISRCLVLLREECPNGERNFYVEG
jgi:hypothetical protein